MADARDLGSRGRKAVRVQIPPSAPAEKLEPKNESTLAYSYFQAFLKLMFSNLKLAVKLFI